MPPKILLDNEKGVYSVKLGREITIAPDYESAENAQYRWTMDGEVLSTRPSLTFYGEELGNYYIYISVTTDSGSDGGDLKLENLNLNLLLVATTIGSYTYIYVVVAKLLAIER